MRAFLVLVLLAASSVAQADDKPLHGIALVIGEASYSGLPPLTNPKDDAHGVADVLGRLGFDVTTVIDADAAKLNKTLNRFVEDAADADVALVYYSGHGVELAGSDYLIPTDADVSTPQTAGEKLVPVDAVLDKLRRAAPVTILLLDACRTSPFAPGQTIQLPDSAAPLPVAAAGLAVVRGPGAIASSSANAPPESLGAVIGFAASPGQPALDGEPGTNSPYAAALIKHLGAGGYSFGDLMTLVSEEVYLKTKAHQLPWVNSSLRRVLNFGPAIEDPNPDETALRQGRRQLLLAIASEPPATRSVVEGIASAQDVPLDALYGMLKVLGVDTSGGAADLEAQLAQGAKQLKTFKEQELGTAGADPELVRLATLAKRAQDEGAMQLALKYREDATARARVLSSERDTLEEGLKADRLEIGKTFGDHGETAWLNFDYETAANMFGEAYDQVARWDSTLAANYKWSEAGALRDFGDFKNNSDRLQKAIAAYRQALQMTPRETNPEGWAAVDNDLGWALYTLGSRQSDNTLLTEAIGVLRASIDASSSSTPPTMLAINRLNLGNALTTLGDRESDPARLREAIEVFGTALGGLTQTSDPYNWAKIQLNLASALRMLGEREAGTASLDKSVTAFEAAFEVLTREMSPRDWSMLQNNYAIVLFDLSQRSQDPAKIKDLLDRSATALNLALEERKENEVPLDWAMSQSNLGDVYVALSQLQGGDADSLRKGIDAFKAGMRQIGKDKVPLLWATEQSNIGVALTSLYEITKDRQSLSDAVAAFKDAVEVRTEAVDGPGWAMTELNLSGALEELGTDEVSPAHLEEAVAAAEGALRMWSEDRSPILWAKAHYARGNALGDLGDRVDGTDLYLKALPDFEAALTVFTPERSPTEWLLTTKHYALILQSVGEREQDLVHLDAAAKAYGDALAATPVDTSPAEYGRLNYNLGLTLENLDSRGEKGAIDKAIAAFRAALLGYTRERSPADWADAQYRLGYGLHAKATPIPDDIDDVRAAIAAYQASLEVKTRDAVPFEWAEIQNYIGMAHGLLATRINDKPMLQQGRAEIATAWEIYKSHDASYDADFQGRLAQFDAAIAAMP